MNALPKMVGLIGYPLGHTLSPQMHEAAFIKLNLNFRYSAFEVPPQKLSAAIQGIRALNFIGINITVPHKESVMEFIDEFDERAKKIGAVNTILNNKGKLIGYNTDAPGFLHSLRDEGGFIPRGKKAVICGAGGAARSIASSLASAGITRLVITDIDKRAAKILSRHIKKHFDCEVAVYESGEDRALFRAIQESDLLVNATPVGLKPGETIPILLKSLHKKLFVYDVIYADTRLIKAARKKGLQSLNGIGMLVGQGAEAFKIWTNQDAPVEIMRRAVEDNLKTRFKKKN
ncbi:MAG: shikimate dehydrogenase [bacterium]